jgi:hypothetical protein
MMSAQRPRFSNIFAVDADGRGIGRFMRIGARLASWPLALLTLIAVVLELGVYRTEIKIPGPFTPEAGPPYHLLILEIPRGSLATRWRQRPLGDNAQQLGSELDLYIDGHQVRPPHSAHQAIREGTTTGFSHWENVVIFALPPDVENGPETTVTLSYPARPRRGLTFALALLTALLGGFVYKPRAGFFARALAAVQGRIPRLVFWPLAVLTLMALILEFGAYQTEIKIPGPFAHEAGPPYHSLILEIPRGSLATWWRQRPLGDDAQRPFRSELELRIDGRPVRPPHSEHPAIRESTTTGFSHWENVVIFALPPDIKNGPETTVTLSYPTRPRRGLTFTLAFLAAISGLILLQSRVGLLAAAMYVASVAKRYQKSLTFLVGTPHLILFGLCWVGLAASAFFVGSSFYAWVNGWSLPTTALIRRSAIAQWAVNNEPYLGYLLLTLAGIGASVSWMAGSQARRGLPTRLLALCGFAVAACAFILCDSAMWSGILRPGDPHFANVGGLIPFLDAEYYLGSSYDQVRGGVWNEVSLRRPLAIAFRSVLLVFGNFSLPLMLVLQACLVAAATCFATIAVAAWRGIWAGVTFFALTYIYARYFVPTTLTEPLGLFWALLSIPFFIEAFRSRSEKPALIAFALTTIALMTRMGSMFTIPALLIWLVWQFGRGAAAKLRVFTLALVIFLGIAGMNSLLKNVYGTDPGTSNFYYVICGLTIGTTWDGCVAKLASEGKSLDPGEPARAKQLYAMAWDNFKAKPGVFFGRLASGATEFVTRLPDLLWKGYGAIPEPEWLWRKLLTAVCLIGLFQLARKITAVELTFWALVWASIVASASIVYFDDGARTLAASHPLIALFFAMGMGDPAASAPAEQRAPSRLSGYGALGLIVTAALFICIPWMAHRFAAAGEMAGNPLLQKPAEAFVFGGRRMTGFLVVADGQPLRSDIPSLHFADFDAMIARSDMELYQDLIHPVIPTLPFGFVFAPRLEKDVQSLNQFIVPAEVLERPDVPSWRFQLKSWGYRPTAGYGELWSYVTKAEPWPCIDRFREAIETGRCRN